MEKKLYRSATDKKICGVCGGLAKYIGMDSSILRVIWALITLLYGAGLVLYIICALVIPAENN